MHKFKMAGSKLVKTVSERSLIPLNSLLLFFLLFEPRIVLPAWLQVFGRMHPLVLHFPIVLILIYAVITLFLPSRLRNEHWYRSAINALLLAAAFSASITALMGFALSRNEGYDPDALALHKWTGVLIPFLLHAFYLIRNKVVRNIHVARMVSIFLAVMISVAGHHGAVITHGENFILAPVTPVQQRIIPAFEDAFVYNDLVQPIFDNKCAGCHNSKKAKGELVMDTKELFLKGGKDGVPWDTTKADLGVMMRRIHMPLEEKDHMPPKGKPQLTDDEMFIIHEWVKKGADFNKKFTDLQPTDTLYVIGKKALPSSSEENYDFAAADQNEVLKLNNNNRVISPVATGSPALNATFYNRSLFTIESLKELAPVNDKIVELNIPKMPVKDEHLSILKQFRNIRRLNLNFTELTGKTLEQLQSLPNLKMLSLSGTSVDYNSLRKLQNFPKLKTVYLWSTPAAKNNLKDLEQKNKNISYYAGFTGDTVKLQLTPPILENEDHILAGPEPLKLKHYITGSLIRYTLDGTTPDSIRSPVYKEGLVIDSNVTLKAIAYKDGWYNSSMLQHHFYKKNYLPDSIQLL
ncbi:MAG TPA: FN3 associated domain-containing protein, partial [Flavitalea sp.]|nr:FN3 associated domain-containing protein [Flavitalea sp.]